MAKEYMQTTSISLVVPTIGRVSEVQALLESIVVARVPNMEVIVVDQNRDDRLVPAITLAGEKINIRHERVDFRGVAKARNHGASVARGQIINFPDDDETLDPETIRVALYLLTSHDVDAVAGRVLDPVTRAPALLNFPDVSLDVDFHNFFRTTLEVNLFWRRDSFMRLAGFDEDMGVGRYHGSEEGADAVLRALYQGMRLRYFPDLKLFHPDKRQPDFKKSYAYGRGFGRLLRKHWKRRKIDSYARKYLVNGIGGGIVYAAWKPRVAASYIARVAGAIRGAFVLPKYVAGQFDDQGL